MPVDHPCDVGSGYDCLRCRRLHDTGHDAAWPAPRGYHVRPNRAVHVHLLAGRRSLEVKRRVRMGRQGTHPLWLVAGKLGLARR